MNLVKQHGPVGRRPDATAQADQGSKPFISFSSEAAVYEHIPGSLLCLPTIQETLWLTRLPHLLQIHFSDDGVALA